MNGNDLIATLRAADMPSLALDRRIAQVAGWKRVPPKALAGPAGKWRSPDGVMTASLPRFTETIDAARRAVPPGYSYEVREFGQGGGDAMVWNPMRVPGEEEYRCRGDRLRSPALALATACMMAWQGYAALATGRQP